MQSVETAPSENSKPCSTNTDPTGLVPWLLQYIDATQSPEGLWLVMDAIKNDKEAGEPYLTNKALDTLRKASKLQRDKLAEIEHQQALTLNERLA